MAFTDWCRSQMSDLSKYLNPRINMDLVCPPPPIPFPSPNIAPQTRLAMLKVEKNRASYRTSLECSTRYGLAFSGVQRQIRNGPDRTGKAQAGAGRNKP